MDIPKEFEKFNTDTEQLLVGQPGKIGMIDLELQNKDSKTVITKQSTKVPLQIQKAIYPDATLPEMAYLYIMSPSGGILQGDRYHTDIDLKNSAKSHITTQGATRIYSMNSNYASQKFNITAGNNCYLEYMPDQIIPYRDSRYYQHVNLKIHDNATLAYMEVLTPGRVAMNESFDYDICYLRTYCENQDGKIRFFESSKIVPEEISHGELGMFGKYDTIGTMYILTRKDKILEIYREINETVKGIGSLQVGTSITPDSSGVIVRILANRADCIYDIGQAILVILRSHILDVPLDKHGKD